MILMLAQELTLHLKNVFMKLVLNLIHIVSSQANIICSIAKDI